MLSPLSRVASAASLCAAIRQPETTITKNIIISIETTIILKNRQKW
jgi:hypothetical protein